MRELLARLRDWLRRDQLDAELAEELRFHRDRLERDARSSGATDNAAPYAAKRRLGNVTRAREEARDRWALPWLDHLQQDVRYAFRGLRRSPGFTVAVVLTLGLGIGANAAMFGVVDRLMFRAYPYLRDPANVNRVYLRIGEAQRLLQRETFPYTRYRDLANWTTSFSADAGFCQTTSAVGTGEQTRERPILAVSASFFGFFDARPALGRFFAASEDVVPTGTDVAVLSFAHWKNEFGGRNVLGQAIQVGTVKYAIIGVAPENFVGVSDGEPPVVFIPITTYGANEPGGSAVDYHRRYNWDWTEMIVRRKPGVSAAAASSDLTNAFIRSRVASRALIPAGPQVERYHPVATAGAVKTAGGPYPGLEAKTLLWVTGVAVVVLLIACANVANLCLARALRRRREVALRLALGVSRGRLLAQSLTESMVLSLLGCVVGIATAQWGGLALRRLFLPDASAVDLITDVRTLAVAVACALVAGLLTGFAPVILANTGDLAKTLKAGAREGTYQRSRLRSTLLVFQGALSVVLLVGAGLFVKSLNRVRDMHLGYDASHVLLVDWTRRGTDLSPSERVAFRRRVIDAARAIPGVQHAAWVSSVPFMGTSVQTLSVPGIDSVSRLGRFTFQTAGDDYFATMGTRILRGRAFSSADGPNAPNIAVVSEGMARLDR
ncbi:MAG TPA: ABC transporter permease, partial [Gemmatimonadaceae bacterium]|nr:ABC transporter permease [Gemmatimonadaceae bacterium]